MSERRLPPLIREERDEYRKRFCLRSMWSEGMTVGLGRVLDCRDQDTRDASGNIKDGFRQVNRCAVCYAADALDAVPWMEIA